MDSCHHEVITQIQIAVSAIACPLTESEYQRPPPMWGKVASLQQSKKSCCYIFQKHARNQPAHTSVVYRDTQPASYRNKFNRLSFGKNPLKLKIEFRTISHQFRGNAKNGYRKVQRCQHYPVGLGNMRALINYVQNSLRVLLEISQTLLKFD